MTGTLPRSTVTNPAVGQSVRRKEDARLLTGATNWTDNIQLPGALHMEFVRSPFAHARISRIDQELLHKRRYRLPRVGRHGRCERH